MIPKKVTLVEVGPRDGLQNEIQIVPTATKIEFIHKLAQTGLSTIETTSFVSPKWIPQMADHSEVFRNIQQQSHIHYPVLVPNLVGIQNAIAVGVKDISVFTATSETFSQKNTNCSLQESLARIKEVITVAKQNQLKVRGYLSCVIACPYEGLIAPEKTATMTKTLLDLGCEQISLGDTIGAGTPGQVKNLLDCLLANIPANQLAVHFHDTFGQALANIYTSLEYGINTIDCAVAGLGGCPYAQGASGNVASEDVLYMLNGLGIETGVDLQKLIDVGDFICAQLNRKNQSKVALAMKKIKVMQAT